MVSKVCDAMSVQAMYWLGTFLTLLELADPNGNKVYSWTIAQTKKFLLPCNFNDKSESFLSVSPLQNFMMKWGAGTNIVDVAMRSQLCCQQCNIQGLVVELCNPCSGNVSMWLIQWGREHCTSIGFGFLCLDMRWQLVAGAQSLR